METENNNPVRPFNQEPKGNVTGRVLGGMIVLTVGVVLLARQAGADIPHWLLSWPMILIVVGLYIGVRHNFRNPVWIILVVTGSIFLADVIDPMLDFHHYLWPIIIITIGLIMIFRPQKKLKNFGGTTWSAPPPPLDADATISKEDFIDTVTIFGGVKKNVFSKNFRGGDITTIFGGTEINLTQADVPHKIELDITQIFGGAKLIVPPHWRIQSEDIVSIFGGVEDKRPIMPDSSYDPNKVLILKGTNIFGGIDIKSF